MSTQIRKYEPSTQKLRMLIYGGSGVGKTYFGSTAPNPLFLSAEEGLLCLAEQGVNYVEIKTKQDLENIYFALKNNNLKDQNGKPIKCDTVIIDSLTEIQQVIINKITGGRQPSQREWGEFSNQMAEVLRKFKGLDKHLVFICLENEKADEDDNGREYSRFAPELYGKLMQKTAALVDMVGRYYMKVEVKNNKPTSKRVLTFQYSPRYIAKDRSGKLPAFVEPDFSALLKACKIKVGAGKVVAELEDAPRHGFSDNADDLPLPEKKEPITTEQGEELFQLWTELVELGEVAHEKSDITRRMTIKKLYGVKSSNDLTEEQAQDFIQRITARIENVKAKEERPAPKRPVRSQALAAAAA